MTGVFAGIQDLTGFDRVVIDVNGPATGHVAADLFRFDTPSATGVPAPATLALLGAGLLVVAWLRRR